MLVETAYREYREAMIKGMIGFSQDPQAAQDGVAQAFVKAVMHKQLLEAMPEPAMKAWLYAAARNAVVDIKRRERRLSEVCQELFYAETVPPQIDEADKAAVKALLGKLPLNLLEPIKMKYFEGLNATEIGRSMRLPPGTVRTRLRKALELMRNIF
ncbi:MAG: RNA polymerase sigma factor [Treponema sp.]|jgi:RNA polymerase sigma-70 factor (ECF subfamily)|nr:RNA polymerase sigma factor [Treponema sp.]